MTNHQLRNAINQQVLAIHNLGYLMPQHLLSFKQIPQIQVLLKLISKHIYELQFIQRNSIELKQKDFNLYVEANTRIKNHIKRKGILIRQLARNDEMQPYAMCALKYLSSILECLQLIEENIKTMREQNVINESQSELCASKICQ